MPLRRNVLLFHLGALGDFLLNWPLAMALARIHPQSRIIYITHPAKAALAEKLLRIESASIESGFHHLYGDASQLPDPARKLLAGAHSIYSFIANDAWSANVRALAPEADLLCLQPTPPADWSTHATDFLLSQLENRKAVAEAVRQMLHSIQSRGLLPSAANPAGPALLHPGSGSPAKCWAPQNFLQLANLLSQRKTPVQFILGEAELERWPATQIRQFESTAPVVRPSTCVDLAASLTGVRSYVGNDSGPTHLAAMLGLPTIALFGPTNPAIWKPLGPRTIILPHSATPDQILASLSE